jgi:hypothetical protein
MGAHKIPIIAGASVLLVLLIATIHDLTIADSMRHWGLGVGRESAWSGFLMVLLGTIIGVLALLIATLLRRAYREAKTSRPLDASRSDLEECVHPDSPRSRISRQAYWETHYVNDACCRNAPPK